MPVVIPARPPIQKPEPDNIIAVGGTEEEFMREQERELSDQIYVAAKHAGLRLTEEEWRRIRSRP